MRNKDKFLNIDLSYLEIILSIETKKQINSLRKVSKIIAYFFKI